MGRLEPKFYLTKYLENRDKVVQSKFKSYKLNELCELVSDGTHFTPKYQENGVKFLSVKDVRQYVISYNNSKFISVEEATLLDKRCKPQKNDILLTKIGATYGYAAVVNTVERFQIFVSLALLRPNTKFISPDFLCLCLNSNLLYLHFERVIKGAGVPDLHLEDIRVIEIPVPPLEIQSEIVEKFNKSYSEKLQKEAEAKELLASIDAYLLEQLGIILPDKIEEKNVFYVPFSKVQGNRFDPKPYLVTNQALYESLRHSKYQKEFLKNLLIQSVAGDWGIEENKEGFEERLVIRATEFDNLYNLNLENNRVKYRFINQIRLEKMDLQVGDLLIEKSGGSENQPVGRIALITSDIAHKHKLGYSNFIHKMRVDKRVDSTFLFYFLKTIHNIRITDIMQSQTNGIRNLIMREYFNIPVTLPPLEIQTEIANHIRNIRERAKTLEIEAKEVIEKAKAEVEKMILGE